MKLRRLIVPIIVILLVVIYLGITVAGIIFSDISLIFKLLSIIVPLFIIGASIYVLIERIHEIRSGEQDDLSKY